MAYIDEIIASAATLTITRTMKTAEVFTTNIAQVGQGGQCDCDAGLRRSRFGKPYPCGDCPDGDRMADCLAASDHEEYLDRVARTNGDLQ